jgi:SpoVK/Ycf46/Vps4 family AAA+-type ATPase
MMPMRRLLDGKSTDELMEMKKSGSLDKVGRMMQSDFEKALENTKPSMNISSESLNRFKKWEKEFGSK